MSEIVTVLMEELENIAVLNAAPLPKMELLALASVIVDDPALRVKPVPANITDPATATAELPSVRDRVNVPDVLSDATVNAKLFVENAPAVNVRLPPELNAPASVHPPPTPLKVTEGESVLPAVLIVFPVVVEVKVISPLALHTVVVVNAKEPAIERVPLLENVGDPADTVRFAQLIAPERVTV